ncbi:MAG: D-aminoacylase [Pyrinomonadaceae bacterium]|nr:D-aminoacylase [Pyrinomonadaceae bacterium]
MRKVSLNLRRISLLQFVLISAIIVSGFACLLKLDGALSAHAEQPAALQYDLVIKNARIVDGTGNPWFVADIAIKDKRIALIGRIGAASVTRTIDARGLTVAPGFIDVHAHTEGIYNQPEAENFIRMGVTSLVTGNCGSSTTDVAAFLGRIKERPLAVNIGTLIAHGSVRGKVVGLEARAPSGEEMRGMEALVEGAMRDGALGLSTGLIYVPGTYAKTDEVVALARVAARHNGLYATHMRDEGSGVMDAIRESIAIGEQANLPVEISHFKISSRKLWGNSTDTLGLVRDARRRGLQVTVDQYAYTASSTSLDVLLPDWALEGGRDEGRRRVEDAETHKRIVREMREGLKRSGFKDYSYAVVAGYDADKSFNGLSIVEITNRVRGKKSLNEQIEQILEMYKAGGAGMVYHKMSEEDVRRIMQEPFTMIAADSGVRRFGEGAPHPRGYGNNARVLARYVREQKALTLEDAVRKMTSLPAQTFNLRDRGLLREGMMADLVIFDPQTISDEATFDRPHQYPTGISRVLVNGEIVFENNRMTEARPGMALRGAGATKEAMNVER